MVWGDKTPKYTFHLESIHSVFPNAKYIHLVRHGGDVIHSYLRTGLRQDLVYSAKMWKKAVLLAKSFGASHISQYLEVRYEDLVKIPIEWTKHICDFLGIEYRDGMVHGSRDIVHKMGDVHKFDHFSSVRRPITTELIGKGVQAFSDQQLETINNVIGKTLNDFGYEL